MVETREVYRDEGVSFFAVRELFIVQWRASPTLAQMDKMRELGRRHEAEVSGGCGLFNTVSAGKPDFSPAIRQCVADFTADGSFFRRFRAHVILLGGLRGLAVELLVNTATRLSRTEVPTSAFHESEAACGWALPFLADTAWTAASVAQTLAATRPDAPAP